MPNYGTNIALPGTMQILLFGAGYKYSYLLTYLPCREFIIVRCSLFIVQLVHCSAVHYLLEFIIEQGHRVNWVSGSLDSRVTGSLGHKM